MTKDFASSTELVSVVVPALNAERTLGETLDSIRNQTHRNLEVIIVDDGSTDATPDLAKTYAARDPRITLIRQPNAGVAAARNAGLAASRGEYVAPIDADDVWHPLKIAKQLEVMRAAKTKLGFVYCPHRVIDAEGRVIRSSPLYSFDGFAFSRHILINFVGNGSTTLFRRSAAVEAGGYDPSLRLSGAEGCEDLMLQMKVCRRYEIGVAPEYLVGYRRLASSMSSNVKAMNRSQIIVMEKWLAEEADLSSWPFTYKMSQGLTGLALEHLKDGEFGEFARLGRRAFQLDPGGAVRGAVAWRMARFATRMTKRMKLAPSSKPQKSFWDFDPSDDPATSLTAIPRVLLSGVAALDRGLGQRLAEVAQLELAMNPTHAPDATVA